MKVALVHDDLIQYGGAERLLLALTEIWPDAPVYTSFYEQNLLETQPAFKKLRIATSWMQKLPFKTLLRRFYFPLYPLAFESFNFDEYHIVISSSTRFAHSVITKPKTIHICYLNSVPRYLWDENNYLSEEKIISPFRFLVRIINSYLRVWDVTAATRVDVFIANSKNVANKIAKVYRRQAKIIYPFVDFQKFSEARLTNSKPGDYFLVVTRLLAWKRVDIAIEAFNQLRLPLKIVGRGPDISRLRKLAKDNIEFRGYVEDAELIKLYRECKALVVTQDEDFGIAICEAQAAGRPVIAYNSGGAREIVIEGKTGIFFESQTKDSLIEAVRKFEKLKFNPSDCVTNANRFRKDVFINNLKLVVEDLWRQKMTD
ncbi:MAG: glycosyltransferase [Nitrososphaerota archaeon]